MTRRADRPTALPREAGVTLVEVIVVVAIAALVAGITIASIGSLGRTRLRGSAFKTAAAIQRGFSYAATHGEATRLVVDIDENTFTLERGEGRLLLDTSVEGGMEDRDEEDEEGGNVESEAPEEPEDEFSLDLGLDSLTSQIQSGFHSGEVPRYKPPVFQPVSNKRFNEKPFDKGVTVLAVHSPLYIEPKQDGQAYIYFFPDGMGDPAVIQLQNDAGLVYSVEVQPLMSRARIHNYAYVPELEEVQW